MNQHSLPDIIPNWIKGEESAADSGESFDNLSPATGQKLCGVTRSGPPDVQQAIQAARSAQAPEVLRRTGPD
jgi:acyl-CoA reductase-like NAD-dependent aldehyde dehydrogenase